MSEEQFLALEKWIDAKIAFAAMTPTVRAEMLDELGKRRAQAVEALSRGDHRGEGKG